ncbi:hypothetical protein CPC08DRAFT_759610 [Agrocybe pediades]|nr:hypothetical protein CPC08DRAFT_759610 [Agrocybe pediades]
MSAEPQEVIGLVFLVESSLPVAHEWRRLLSDYAATLIKRLTDCHPGSKALAAFVSYGAADHIPSPIITKRYFTDMQTFAKELPDFSRLGLGTTNAGGSRGMAALDGFVATLELFDTLHNLYPQRDSSPKPVVSHIIHIAACPPDASKHPTWNDSFLFDDLDWESLSLEMKKRHIQLNTINLQPNLSRFSELHSAVVTGASTPWFNVSSAHKILLASFGNPPQQLSKASAKRQNDTVIERPTDSKRPRLQANVDSPKPGPKAPTPSQTLPIAPTPPQTQPQQPQPPPLPQPLAPPQLQPPLPVPQPPVTLPPRSMPSISPPSVTSPAGITAPAPGPAPGPASGPSIQSIAMLQPAHQQQLINNFRLMAEQLQKLEATISKAKADGDSSTYERLMVEYNTKKESQKKFATFLTKAAHMRREMQMRAAQQAQAQAQAHSNSQQPQGPQSSTMSNPTMPLPNFTAAPPNFQMAADPQLQHGRSHSETKGQENAVVPAPNMSGASLVPNGPPNITAQMQKIIDQQQQQQRLRNAQAGPNPMNPMLAPRPGALANGFNGVGGNVAMPNQAPQLQQPPFGPQKVVVWSGPIQWSGTTPAGLKKDVRAFVDVFTANVQESQAGTWPKVMILTPTREPLVSQADLSQWVRRTKPAMCTFQASPNVPDAKTNKTNFDSLVQILTTRNVMATAAWTRPSATHSKNVLIFPFQGIGLVGAFFPVTGLPDIPRSTGQSIGPTLNGIPIPPQIAAQLQAMTPEQRARAIAQIMQHRQQQQQHQAQQAQQQFQPQQAHLMSHVQNPMIAGFPQGMNAPQLSAHGTMNAALNTMANSQGPGPGMMMGMNAPQASFPATLPRMGNNTNEGNVPGNVSLEMMQSFIRRNADGSGNANLQT